jgi:SAM-dependent methyltransferase
MAHVEYRSWLKLIKDILNSRLPSASPSILEIGGGTGAMGRLLLDENFEYQGSDKSSGMCAQALAKEVPFACADGLHLPFKKRFDMALFLYDGINYLLNPHDYTQLCTEVHACLRPKGLFLFDVTTETNSMMHFLDFLDFEDYGDCAYIRHSYFEQSSTLQFNDFTIFSRTHRDAHPDLFEKHQEQHVQKVLPVAEISKSIPDNLFSIIGIWDGFSFRKYSSRSKRIHFLCRKI